MVLDSNDPEYVKNLIALLMIKTRRKIINIKEDDVKLFCDGVSVVMKETDDGICITLVDNND